MSNLNPQQFYYHVSPKSNRESIETHGLIPNKWMETVKKGVYMTPGYVAPEYARGEGDIYRITQSKRVTVKDDDGAPGAVYSRRKISTKDFTRIGHVYQDDKGEQIHDHVEEDCKGREKSE